MRLLALLGSRRVLVLLDQAASSLSNVVVTVMVARVLTPADFGAFSVALIAYQLAIGTTRATVGEPWLSTDTEDEGPGRAQAVSDLVYAALAASIPASVAMVVAGAALSGGPTLAALTALAVVLPYLAVQDCLRFVCVRDRPGVALASDVTWLVGVVALLAVAPRGAPPEWFVVAWGMAGAAGLVVEMALLRVPLWTGSARRWFRTHRVMAGAFLAENVSARAASHLVLLGLGGIAGLGALGAVRAAQVFYGPINTIFAGAYMALIPDGVRRRESPARLRHMMVVASAVIASCAAAWVLVGQLLPERYGTELFGETWERAEAVLLPVGIATVAGSVTTGAFSGIRSLGDARLSLRARITSLPPQVLCSLVGAVVGAATGYGVGLAVGNTIVAATWWALFLGAIARRRDDGVTPPSPLGDGDGDGDGDGGDGGDDGGADARPRVGDPQPPASARPSSSGSGRGPAA